MESKRIVCDRCRQSSDIVKDFTTGLWELPLGAAKISRLSWEALWETWMENHNRECCDSLAPLPSTG